MAVTGRAGVFVGPRWVVDPDDPTPYVHVSIGVPERLADAIRSSVWHKVTRERRSGDRAG
ncbi:hypothetical protein ACFV7R_34445 [Streptomyces sp. NPDC059866]|uniref:hypothetical protein n=1 Tax=Streptomyces sp. NPDC059866 TaxID=3346978 RepID=UPI003650B457